MSQFQHASASISLATELDTATVGHDQPQPLLQLQLDHTYADTTVLPSSSNTSIETLVSTSTLFNKKVSPFVPKKIPNLQKAKIDYALLKLFVKYVQPFSTVKDEGLIEFTKALNPTQVLP